MLCSFNALAGDSPPAFLRADCVSWARPMGYLFEVRTRSTLLAGKAFKVMQDCRLCEQHVMPLFGQTRTSEPLGHLPMLRLLSLVEASGHGYIWTRMGTYAPRAVEWFGVLGQQAKLQARDETSATGPPTNSPLHDFALLAPLKSCLSPARVPLAPLYMGTGSGSRQEIFEYLT